LKAEHKGLRNLPLEYRDIDLRLVPEEQMHLDYQKAVLTKGFLPKMGYPVRGAVETSNMRHHIVSSNTGLMTFVDFGYGTHSVRSSLKNGTGLDLILGKRGDVGVSPDEILSREREGNCAFSLLYRHAA